MTSGNVNNFVSDLVLMAKAMEELPQVKQELEAASAGIDKLTNIVQSREESIARLKAELEASHEARRKVEAERDDAELRFLESEDRTASALSFIKSTFGSAGSLIQALEPPAPAAVAVPSAEAEVIHIEPGLNPSYAPVGQEDVKVGASEGYSPFAPSESHPIPSNGNGDPTPTDAPPIPANGTETMGQGATDPTSDATHNTTTESHSAPAASPMDIAATLATEPAKPFALKRYYDHPTYLTLAAWLDGGGTEADYNWRPAPYKSGNL